MSNFDLFPPFFRLTQPRHVLSLVFILLAWLTSGSAMAADWSASFNGKAAGSYVVNASAVDSSGNIYLAGDSSTNIGFGSAEVNRIGNYDAFVVKLDATGSAVWLKNFGGSGARAWGLSIAVDSIGNVYLGGRFDSANLTTPALTKIGDQDAFAIMLDSSGTTVWAKNFGGSGASAEGNSIAVDSTGNVYLGGTFSYGDLTNVTPALTRIGQSDAYVLKLDSAGDTTWAKNFGGSSGALAQGSSIAVDSATGNVHLGGNFQLADLTNPDNSTLLAKMGSQTAFAIQLDSAGATNWAKRFGGTNVNANAIANSIAVDIGGNVYLGGEFSGANLTNPNNTTLLEKIGDRDAFAFKLDSDGNTTWAKRFGGIGASAQGNSIAVDSTGNVYLGGDFAEGPITNVTPTLPLIGYRDAFAIKLNSSGTTMWAKNFGGGYADAYGASIAVDSTGNVYLGGYFESENLTTPALTRLSSSDAFAITLDSDGTTTLALNPGGLAPGANVTVKSTTVDSAGNMYIAGNFSSVTFTLGSRTLTRIGNQDAFAAKLDAGGTVLWAKNYGGNVVGGGRVCQR